MILTVTWSPSLVLGTNTENPLTRPIPSPLGVVSVMSTSYSLPISTGHSRLPRLFLAFRGVLFLGQIGQRTPFDGYY